MSDIVIRGETPADYAAVENLVRESFWNVYRPGCLEHFVLHRLRDAPEFVRYHGLPIPTASRLQPPHLYKSGGRFGEIAFGVLKERDC